MGDLSNGVQVESASAVILVSYSCDVVSAAEATAEPFDSTVLASADPHGMHGAALASVSWIWHELAISTARKAAGSGWIALDGGKSYVVPPGKRSRASTLIPDFAELENPRDSSVRREGVVHVPGPIDPMNVGDILPTVAVSAVRLFPPPNTGRTQAPVCVFLDTPANRERLLTTSEWSDYDFSVFAETDEERERESLARTGWSEADRQAWNDASQFRSNRRLFSTPNERVEVSGAILGTDVYSAEATIRALELVEQTPGLSFAEILSDPLLGDQPEVAAEPVPVAATNSVLPGIRERVASGSLSEDRIEGLLRAYAALEQVLSKDEPWRFLPYRGQLDIKDPGSWRLRLGPTLDLFGVDDSELDHWGAKYGIKLSFYIACEVRKFETRCIVEGGFYEQGRYKISPFDVLPPLPTPLQNMCFSTKDIGLPPLGWNDVLDEGATKTSRCAKPSEFEPFAVEIRKRLQENAEALNACVQSDIDAWLQRKENRPKKQDPRRWLYQLPSGTVAIPELSEWKAIALSEFPNSVLWDR